MVCAYIYCDCLKTVRSTLSCDSGHIGHDEGCLRTLMIKKQLFGLDNVLTPLQRAFCLETDFIVCVITVSSLQYHSVQFVALSINN